MADTDTSSWIKQAREHADRQSCPEFHRALSIIEQVEKRVRTLEENGLIFREEYYTRIAAFIRAALSGDAPENKE